MDLLNNSMNLPSGQQIPTVNAPAATPAPTPAATAAVPSADESFKKFLDQLLSNISKQEQEQANTTNTRNQYRTQVDQKFGPDYGNKAISSTLLDDTINSILTEQKTNASEYLERGKRRGIYNDVGYNAGVSRIGTAGEAGRSQLYSLGNSIIDKYRDDANAVRDKAYSAASGYTPGTSFSLDPYIRQGNEIIGRANTMAPGELRNTFGGTQLFDFSSLTNAAGQAQGAINARDLDVMGAITQRKRANAFGRGLGSQGAF